MFAIEVHATFTAAHQLRLPPRLGGGVEPLHEHLWKVTVQVTSAALDDLETVTDFHLVEKHLKEVLDPWENRNLNELEPFVARVNPTAERVAEHIGEQLIDKLKGVRVVEVRLTEAPGCVAIWRR